MTKVHFTDKFLYTVNLKEYTIVANMAAQKSKDVAMYFYSNGIKGNARQKDVLRLTNRYRKNVFDKDGNLTDIGRFEFLDTLKDLFGLKTNEDAKKITIKQFLKLIIRNSTN